MRAGVRSGSGTQLDCHKKKNTCGAGGISLPYALARPRPTATPLEEEWTVNGASKLTEHALCFFDRDCVGHLSGYVGKTFGEKRKRNKGSGGRDHFANLAK